MIKNSSDSFSDYFDLNKDDFLRKWYREEYSIITYRSSQGLIQSLMHRSLEKNSGVFSENGPTLELGSNKNEHFKFLKTPQEYITSDNNLDLLKDKNKPMIFCDAENLPFKDNSFARVLHMCLLHHVQKPESVLNEMRRVVQTNGVISIFLSSDPGIFFRLARKIGPIRSAKRRGLGLVKNLVDARDHINHVFALKTQIEHVFRSDEIHFKTFPLSKMPLDLSLWSTFQIKIKKK